MNVRKYDKGTFLTDDGVFNWDFAENGVDGILVSEETGEAYKVISTERDENDNVLSIIVN